MKFDTKKLARECIDRTKQIVIGNQYFLSAFYDKEGAIVKVIDKSTKVNSAGWPSTVIVKVIEQVDTESSFYAVGKELSVNACNLYEHRIDARNPFAKTR
jgi:hypothetical protein